MFVYEFQLVFIALGVLAFLVLGTSKTAREARKAGSRRTRRTTRENPKTTAITERAPEVPKTAQKGPLRRPPTAPDGPIAP
eukprot:6554954-Pyramimonas_sp.AAC.2